MIDFNLIKELVKTDFKLKYYGSFLGFFWSLLKPFLMLGILYFVFTYFIKVQIPKFALFLLLGIIIWNYFIDTTNDSMNSIKAKSKMLTKTRLSPGTLVIAASIHNAITLLLNLLVFFIIFFVGGHPLGYVSLYFIVLFILLICIVTSLSLVVILLNIRFTDFKHIWDVLTQILFWATPIVYNLDYVTTNFQRWFLLNPIARIIVDARAVILYNTFPELKQIIITFIISIAICVICYYIYKKNKERVLEFL
ncbi:MAG: ABC transporter permease [Candidatus Woesearchaeota archaeon]